MATEAEQIEAAQEAPAELQEAVEDVQRILSENVEPVYDNAENNEVYQELEQVETNHGFHAYRYEELGDGSVIAIWGRKADQIYYKAFEDVEAASRWSPRDER